MKKIFQVAFCAIFIFSCFFFITEYESYRPKMSHFIGSSPEPFREKGIFLSAKAYDVHDSKAYLDRDLLSMGYQPVQVSIQNNSSTAYYLSVRGLDIPTTKASRVANSVTCRHIPKSIAFKVAGFFFPPLIIPGAIDGIITFKNHQKMKHDYFAKSIKSEEEAILPYSALNRVVFLPKDLEVDQFHLYLRKGNTQNFSLFIVKINS